jgi:hypothetical protein
MIRAFSSSLHLRRRSGPTNTSPRILNLSLSTSLRTSCVVQARPQDDYTTGRCLDSTRVSAHRLQSDLELRRLVVCL